MEKTLSDGTSIKDTNEVMKMLIPVIIHSIELGITKYAFLSGCEAMWDTCPFKKEEN